MKIDKDIPIPAPKALKYPVLALKPGNSFTTMVINCPLTELDRVRKAMHYYKKVYGIRTVSDLVDDDKAVRTWRIE